LLELVRHAEPGSDHQLAFLRGLSIAARSDEALDLLAALLDGSDAFDGLAVDTDLRWEVLHGLAREGRIEDAAVAAELARDNTIAGQEAAAATRAAFPTAEAKSHAWFQAVERDDIPNETMRCIAMNFAQPGQEDILAPYLDRYLSVANEIWEKRGVHHASTVLEYMFPRVLANEETVAAVDAWLETSNANPAARRFVSEGRDDVARSLTAQRRDAELP